MGVHALIARRGRPKVADRSVRSVFFAPVGRHSEKPERFFEIVERLCGEGPRVELFARRRRPGWLCLGDEIAADFSFESEDAGAHPFSGRETMRSDRAKIVLGSRA